jgi:hypothetical protein
MAGSMPAFPIIYTNNIPYNICMKITYINEGGQLVFNKPIASTTLTSKAADRLFSNITAVNTPDDSFLATLRALMRNRLPQNESLRITCKEIHITENEIAATTPARCVHWFVPSDYIYYSAYQRNIVIVYAANPIVGEKMIEIVKKHVGKSKRHMDKFDRREDLRVFYVRKLNALFYTDVNEYNTVIFTDKFELKHFHVLQMMLPKYLPSLFIDKPLTEMETALLKSTGNISSDEYEMLIEEFAKNLDIRSEIIRTKLKGFETAFERMRADKLRDEISGYQGDYEHHVFMLRDFDKKIQERQYTLAGLEAAINEHDGDSELMEYFMCNKQLSIIDAFGTIIEFIAYGYADVFDEEVFKMYVGNHQGYMYKNINPLITKPQMEKLYRAIFVESKYKLRICAAYTADVQSGLKALRNYAFKSESSTYFPNPHIQQFGCIGTYAMRFQEYMRKRDYVGAIDQAAVSARNLNFYDSTVMSAFANEFSNTKKKCLEKADGTLFTPIEAVKDMEVCNVEPIIDVAPIVNVEPTINGEPIIAQEGGEA